MTREYSMNGEVSHIDTSTGKAAFAYTGRAAWHRTGQELQSDASIKDWAQAAGLNWRGELAPVQYVVNEEQEPGNVVATETFKHPSQQVLYRSDTKAPLGIVSKGYQVVQPIEALEFFRAYAEAGEMTLETAGSLHGGRKIFALAKMATAAQDVLAGDRVVPYMLFATSFDGSLSTIAQETAVRVVCDNTIRLALGEKNVDRVRIPHTQAFDRAAVQKRMGMVLGKYELWMKQARRMAETPLSGPDADLVLTQLMLGPRWDGSAEKVSHVRESTTYRKMMRLFEGDAIGAELAGGRTAWGMLNAVTEFVDHHRGNSADNRINSAWFGNGDAMKTRAFELLGG